MSKWMQPMEIECLGNVRITITFATRLGGRSTSYKVGCFFWLGMVLPNFTPNFIISFVSHFFKLGASSRAPSPCKKAWVHIGDKK
jgi:hypothetical protein